MHRALRFCALTVLLVSRLFAAEPAAPRLVLPTSHGEAAFHLAVMADGRFAISGTTKGQLKLWDVSTSTEFRTITLGLSGEETLLALLPRHATQIYAVSTRKITLIEIPSMEVINTVESRSDITYATVSPDGESLYVAGGDRQKQYIQVLRRGRFPLREVMERKRPAADYATYYSAPAPSNDGRFAILRDDPKSPTVLVRIDDGQVLHTFPGAEKLSDGNTASSSLSWSNDGRIILSRAIGPDGKKNLIQFMNPETQQVEWSTELPIDRSYLTYAPRPQSRPDEALVFVALKKFFFLDGTRVDGPYESTGFSICTATPIDSRFVLATTTEGDVLKPQTQQLRKFDRARGSFSNGWSPPSFETRLFAGSSRGDTLFVVDGANRARLLQFGRGGLRVTPVQVPGCYDAVFAPNGREVLFYSGEHDKRLCGVIDIENPHQPRVFKMGFESISRGIYGNTILSPSGKRMVDMRNGSTPVTLYDPYSGRESRSLPNGYYTYDQMSGQAAFSPDDTRLVYFTSEQRSGGRTVNCYDLTTNEKLWERTGFYDDFSTFRYSDDGTQIFAVEIGKKPTLHVFDAKTGADIHRHELPATDQATQAIFNPSGTEIALPAGDSIIIASVADGKELRRCTAPSQLVESLSYLGNNRLASTGPDKAIRLWDAARAELLGTISVSVDGAQWAFIHPSGRFEATEGFQEQMYFVQGTTKVPLSAYFESFHTPGLIGQIMSGETIAAPTLQLKELIQPPKALLALVGSARNLTVEDAPEEVTTEQATLRITAQSEQSKIAEIRLYHNGKLVESRTRNLTVEDDVPEADTGKAGRTENITVTLLPGENSFRAVVINEQRTESAPALLTLDYKAPQAALAGRDGGGMQLHLLVIGVNAYRNPKYNLNYAVPDATAVRDLVQKNAGNIFTKVNVTTLFNEKATRAAILESFTTIAKQSGPRDVFVFYFAGHGVMSSDSKAEFFLAPHELTQLYGADEQLRAKAISSAEVLAASAKISAQKQLFLLDACQSAGALQTVAMRGASEEKAVAQLARASGTHWITASGSEQFATEFEKLGHGTFTYALLEALGGKADNGDGRITVNELKAYLEAQVPELTKLHKGTPQYPASYGFGQDFPLSIISKN